jgi:hypothetical protein
MEEEKRTNKHFSFFAWHPVYLEVDRRACKMPAGLLPRRARAERLERAFFLIIFVIKGSRLDRLNLKLQER